MCCAYVSGGSLAPLSKSQLVDGLLGGPISHRHPLLAGEVYVQVLIARPGRDLLALSCRAP